MYHNAASNWITAKINERIVDRKLNALTNVMMIRVKNATVNKIRVLLNKWVTYACAPCNTPNDIKKNTSPSDHKMANFRGLSDNTGNKKMQMSQQQQAPPNVMAKMSIRSHRSNSNIPGSEVT